MTIRITRRRLLYSSATLLGAGMLGSCATGDSRDYGRVGLTPGFAVVAGARLAPGGTRGPYVGREGELLRRTMLAAGRTRFEVCFALGGMVDDSSVTGEGGRVLAEAYRASGMDVYAVGKRSGSVASKPLRKVRADFMVPEHTPGPDPFTPETPRRVAVTPFADAFLLEADAGDEPAGGVSPGTLAWMKAEAEKTPGRAIFVLLDRPLFSRPGEENHGLVDNAIMVAEALESLDNLAGVVFAADGPPYMGERDGVRYFACGELATWPCAYIELRARPKDFVLFYRTAATTEEIALAAKLADVEDPTARPEFALLDSPMEIPIPGRLF